MIKSMFFNKGLFIFDDSINGIVNLIDNIEMREVDILPLTSDCTMIEDAKRLLGQGCLSTRCFDPIKILDEEIGLLRNGLAEWSARIGECAIDGRTVKEHLAMPGFNISTWWLGLLSEKNPLKTNAFFRIAQTRAIKKILKAGSYDMCLIAAADKNLREAVKSVCRSLNVRVKSLKERPKNETTRLRSLVSGLGIIGDVISIVAYAARAFQRGVIARRLLGQIEGRSPRRPSLLFITYFPMVEKDASLKGVFRNKYAAGLQDKLKELNIEVAWLVMYVPELGDYTYKDAVYMVRDFVQNSEKLFMTEEFFTMRHLFRSLALWFRQLMVGRYLFNCIDKSRLLSDPVGEESIPFVKSLWDRSFYGTTAINGIIHYLIFREAFKKISNINDCLYYCEMQAWEKALNAAKRECAPHVRTIGFLHTSFSKNDFQYLYDKRELGPTDGIKTMPLPDILACNGDLPCAYFEDRGFRNVKKVEALRHIYLSDILSTEDLPARERRRPLLLVAGSIDKVESMNLVRMALSAFPKTGSLEVWFKGHPCMPMKRLFRDMGIEAPDGRDYKICVDDIYSCLKKAWALLVPTSTVAIEALAFGCEVIVPVFPDSMLMNPLADFEGYHHKVRSAEELASAMGHIIDGYRLHSPDEYRRFLKRYWSLNKDLNGWESLLLSKRKQKVEVGAML